MNKKIIIFSCLLGIIFAGIIYFKYKTTEEKRFEIIYMIQIGAYKNYENIEKNYEDVNKYLVKQGDDNLYHVYIGITKNEENVEKLKEFLKEKDYNIYIRDTHINSEEYINYLNTLDYMLKETNNEQVIYNVLENSVSKYKEMVL